MDLIEKSTNLDRRHPWELSRADSVVRLLNSQGLAGRENLRILDVGCGDAFAGRRVREALNACQLVGVDAHLDEETAKPMLRPGETFVRDATMVTGLFDVFLFLDVIEHVEDDVALLRQYIEPHAADGATVLVTVPAFQGLFSRHDVALKHVRRYSGGQLRHQLAQAGLTIERDGYWFGSLLPARAATLMLEKLRSPKVDPHAVGIGQWRGGNTLTGLLHGIMSIENRLLTKISYHGVRLPGLSAWALCRIG
ncbi:MAG: methyltransferase domain-containing protein [Deltaproteobacteria bacterium]|nr:methyltransferase domain-containing protein [Deltaproteobacteria bacterium]